eukprot:gene6201-12567_t
MTFYSVREGYSSFVQPKYSQCRDQAFINEARIYSPGKGEHPLPSPKSFRVGGKPIYCTERLHSNQYIPRTDSDADNGDLSKYRQLPCRTFISSGTCPYRDRCVYLHDPRVMDVNAKSRSRKKNKEDSTLDALFWPVMNTEDVHRRLDARQQPHVVQPYLVPMPSKRIMTSTKFGCSSYISSTNDTTTTTTTNNNEAAVYSMWNHFVAYFEQRRYEGGNGCKGGKRGGPGGGNGNGNGTGGGHGVVGGGVGMGGVNTTTGIGSGHGHGHVSVPIPIPIKSPVSDPTNITNTFLEVKRLDIFIQLALGMDLKEHLHTSKDDLNTIYNSFILDVDMSYEEGSEMEMEGVNVSFDSSDWSCSSSSSNDSGRTSNSSSSSSFIDIDITASASGGCNDDNDERLLSPVTVAAIDMPHNNSAFHIPFSPTLPSSSSLSASASADCYPSSSSSSLSSFSFSSSRSVLKHMMIIDKKEVGVFSSSISNSNSNSNYTLFKESSLLGYEESEYETEDWWPLPM